MVLLLLCLAWVVNWQAAMRTDSRTFRCDEETNLSLLKKSQKEPKVTGQQHSLLKTIPYENILQTYISLFPPTHFALFLQCSKQKQQHVPF